MNQHCPSRGDHAPRAMPGAQQQRRPQRIAVFATQENVGRGHGLTFLSSGWLNRPCPATTSAYQAPTRTLPTSAPGDARRQIFLCCRSCQPIVVTQRSELLSPPAARSLPAIRQQQPRKHLPPAADPAMMTGICSGPAPYQGPPGLSAFLYQSPGKQ